MPILSIMPLLMGAITFYVGIYHLTIYFQLRERREHLGFSLSCFAMGLYDIASAGLYNADNILRGASWYHLQAAAGALFGAFFVMFIIDYLDVGRNKILKALAGYFSLSFIIVALGKTDWIVDLNRPSVKEIQLPFDFLVIYREVEPGIVVTLMYSVAPFAFLYILYLIYRAHQKGKSNKTINLAAGVIFLLCCSTNDGAVATGLYKSVYLFEYGFLVLAIVMGYSLSLEIVEASRLKTVIRDSEQLFRAITENSTDVTIIVDEQAKFKYVSPAITNFGYSIAELIGKDIYDYLDENDKPATEKALENWRNRSGETIRLSDVGFQLKDRSIRCEALITPMLDVNGVRGIVIHARDITEHLLDRLELRKTEILLATALNSLPHDFWILDTDGRVVLQNDAARTRWGNLIGLNAEEVAEQNEQLSFYPARVEQALCGEIVEKELAVEIEQRQYNFLTVTVPIYNGDIVNGVLGFNIDITSGKQAAQAIVKAYEELRQLDQLKNDFLSNVSHELRSPLVTIRGYIELLQSRKSTDPEIVRGWLNTAHNSVKRLGTIINDLFDISRLQSGNLKFNFERIDLTYELNQAIKEFGPRCDAKNIELSLDVADNLSPIEADAGKLRSVILNLLDNAIKFSENQGKVQITARADSKNEFVQVSVSDTGIGIPQTYLDQIFDKFFQIDSSSTRAHEGSGIGLSLARDIVESHGGRIWVTSELGVGSTFHFTVPISKDTVRLELRTAGADQQQVTSSSTPGKKPKLVLIEDDESIRMLVKTAFGDFFDITTAANGEEGLGHLAEFSPEIVLLDLAMPDISGFDVCRKIRADQRHDDTRVIIFSARSSDKEKQLARECGADDFIEKPISLENLEERLISASKSR